jgi:DNA-binding NarL/FixJ family response regulator
MERVRVAVRGVDPLTVAGLARCLRSWPDIVVTDHGPDTPVDVVVVAMDTLSPNEVSLLRRTAADIGRPIVLVGAEIDTERLFIAVECRVVAIISRRAATDGRLPESIRAAAAGGGQIPAGLLGQLLAHVERLNRDLVAEHGPGDADLTRREIEVLRLMADGQDTADIGDALNYAERTVKNIIYAMTKRLNLRNRPHAVAYAMRTGLI